MKTLEWQTSKGEAVRVEIDRHGVDSATCGAGNPQYGVLEINPPKTINGIEVVARIGNIGVSRENHEKIQAVIAGLRAEFEVSPEGIRERLEFTRKNIVIDINDLRRRATPGVRRDENSEGVSYYNPPPSIKEELEKMGEKLRVFDSEHPEIIEEIRRKKSISTGFYGD